MFNNYMTGKADMTTDLYKIQPGKYNINFWTKVVLPLGNKCNLLIILKTGIYAQNDSRESWI
jgi:hypothetical protein